MISNTKTIDLLQNLTLEDTEYVGKSISILAKFASERLPVPTGFVISTFGFNQYTDLSDIRKYFEKSRSDDERQDLVEAFNSTPLPGELQNAISTCYSKISGFTDAHVNVRALILNKHSNEVAHRSYTAFDIRGERDLIEAIANLYREIVSDNLKNIDDLFSGHLKISILVQKAVQSEASGIMFTTDVITKDSSRLVIEAVYGLESGTAAEGIIPDQYLYDKESGEIKEKHISNQEFMMVRQMGSRDTTQKVSISPAWQKRQKIDDKHIIVLAKTGLIIEEELSQPQQVNWSYESGKVWINFIESSNKQKYDIKREPNTLQEKVDHLVSEVQGDGTDVNVHIPESVMENKNILVDLVLEESEPQKKSKKKKSKVMNNDQKPQVNKEPLLEGIHSAGGEAQGEISFDPNNANINHILVLKGDEDISSNLKVSGFIIEDESEILADRLFEYFKVPVITGVALARKILKKGEKIVLNGANAHIYELVPYNEQVEEVEMNIVKRDDNKIDKANFSFPVKPQENLEIQAELNPKADRLPTKDDFAVEQSEVDSVLTPMIDTSVIDSDKDKTTLYEDSKIKVEKKNHNLSYNQPNATIPTESADKKDLSKLLDLVEEDGDVLKVEQKELTKSEVEGVNPNEQLKVWGNSLENIISSSKKVTPSVAADALEHVIEDSNEIEQNSKEFAFDKEENYIASITHQEEFKITSVVPFMPTATKVYVQLINETLSKNFENFDGLVYVSTLEPEAMLEQLEINLERSNGKETLVVCPPYEEEALTKFFEGIYDLRNKGHRNLSIILPDYRNKKEISEVKKLLSVAGLRRSSTFEIFANISRTINVFRISELEEGVSDGVYVDLFRLKMNMLGVDKLTASTKYVEGMKNLVSYIHENLKVDGKTIINITAFENPKKVVQHLFNFGFWGIVCEQTLADGIKKYISKVEQKRITKPRLAKKKGRR